MEPEASSFTNFFLVIARHLGHGPIRNQFAEAIFHEGCKRGMMSRQVIGNFRKASPSVAQRLLSDTIPSEWHRKIKHMPY